MHECVIDCNGDGWIAWVLERVPVVVGKKLFLIWWVVSCSTYLRTVDEIGGEQDERGFVNNAL